MDIQMEEANLHPGDVQEPLVNSVISPDHDLNSVDMLAHKQLSATRQEPHNSVHVSTEIDVQQEPRKLSNCNNIVSIPALHFNKLKKISGTEGDEGNNNGVYCMETDHADTLVQVVPQVTTNSSRHNKPKKAHIRQVVPQGTNFSIILYCLFFRQNKYFY